MTKLIQQTIKKGGQYKGAKGQQLQKMRQFKAKQLQTHVNAAGSSVAKRDGNVVAFGAAAKQIQQAARYQATSIMANTQNMQQLGDKFKAFSQSLQNIVAAINNDANVRRKQLQAQIAAQQKQVAQWSGDSNGTNAVGVYQKQMDASQQKLKVAALQRGSLEKIQKAQKSDSFYKTVADQAKTFVSEDSTLKKYGGQDASKKFAAIFEKMQKKGKNLTDQDRQNNIAQIGKIARQSKDKAMTQFLKNKGVANADKMSAADKYKLDNLSAKVEEVLYEAPTVKLSGGSTQEMGTVVNTVNLSWTTNKDITTQSINQGIGTLDPTLRKYTVTNANITSNRTYTITVGDGKKTASASTSISFQYRIYWGSSELEVLDNDTIVNFSSALASSRKQSRVFNCSGGKYFYFVLPASFVSGISFKANGFVYSDLVTNKNGYTSAYVIYRSANIQTGASISVEVL